MFYFHPPFMVRHLTRGSMDEFTRSIVVKDRWESLEVPVRLSCLPGQPLFLNVSRFMPLCHLYSLQTHANSRATALRYSLPVGIREANPEIMAETFNTYLDTIFDKHLVEYSSLMLDIRGFDHSSRALMVLFKWLQAWKEKVNPQTQSVT